MVKDMDMDIKDVDVEIDVVVVEDIIVEVMGVVHMYLLLLVQYLLCLIMQFHLSLLHYLRINNYNRIQRFLTSQNASTIGTCVPRVVLM
jgi:hypothetical protein